jgi:hypothetical protein
MAVWDHYQIHTNLSPLAANWFARSDTPDGRQWGPNGPLTPPQAAVDEWLRALASGEVVPTTPQGEQQARALGWSPAGPTDPNYVQNQLAGGANWADLIFGQIPNAPANQQATVQMRQLMLDATRLQEAADLARYSAEEATRLGDQAAALAAKTQADNHQIEADKLKQQADQFAATHGLEREKFEAEKALGWRKEFFEEDKYVQELAANPRNYVQAALAQGNRRPGSYTPGVPNGLLGLEGQAGVGAAGAGGAGGPSTLADTLVPYAGVASALKQRAYVPQTGVAQASGFASTLGDIQNSPALRLSPDSGLDLASLRNAYGNETDRGFIDSITSAQGQNANDFWNTVKNAGRGQSASSFGTAF